MCVRALAHAWLLCSPSRLRCPPCVALLSRYLKEDAFFARPLYYRFFYMWVSTSLVRFNYYTAWGFAETAFIACGLGFNGLVDEKDPSKGHKWNRVASYQLFDVEFAPNIRSTVMFWNMRTQQWLANYVYLRFPRDSKGNVRGVAVLITNLLSAAWHGWYSGYVASFATAALYVSLARELRRVLRPNFVTLVETGEVDGKTGKKKTKEVPTALKPVYDVLSWAVTMSFMSYSFCSFVLLDGSLYVRVWESLFYLGHILPILAFVIIKVFFPPKRRVKTD
jgi:lysophospholipid acyltransferase